MKLFLSCNGNYTTKQVKFGTSAYVLHSSSSQNYRKRRTIQVSVATWIKSIKGARFA